ncbi:S8 family peptidase [Spirilliplanes yamanashiensis]|uniref:Serine protease n=1 Tax=Spirilliplanes yamanashiensis TaxID=42233 RepID=A0A8J3Y8G2_9ACTN|nr:S8 family serine peptidase [Spirilliplanes yamanashiensis]MDP9815574.1 subtilisin family serine protease [Spirilliplanes yamanashiensis]GIJ03828.1 serine protease [Spirilliplanes yamanashiensis]
MPSRTRAGFCLLSLAAALAMVPPATAAAAPPDPAPAPSGDARTVTLVTGDRFAVANGGRSVVKLPSPGREHVHYLTQRIGGRLEVVPADAQPLLAAGRLDPRLFDVTTLLEFGYDDSRAELPLIVEYAGGAAGAKKVRAGAAAADADVVKDLGAVGGLAVEQERDRAADLWDALTTPAGAGTRGLRGEVAKVWLDGLRELQLDESVPLIGAPEAWRAGYTGEGVSVGVIDGGVDDSHPDLAGRVVARDFTGTGLTDVTGHGTHVASTIAGKGGRSGVAPGASIYSGKACPDRRCAESAMLDAMRWMAADLRLRVVNISIGSPDSPGVDQLEEAVDTLSRAHGTLFVVSAGNSGANVPVGSPASADAALAVAATGKDDTLADYSSVGPRADAGTLKPEIAAPGTDITAAAAASVGSATGYTTMSGTSMAAPHVAGAAALLAQRHPQWTATQLKAALMASTRPLAEELSPYEQGAGRLDAARAVTQSVTTEPASVQVDDLSAGGAAVTRTVTYRNAGPADVTLKLGLTGRTTLGKAAPAGMFALGADTVTVPAGGESTVDVVVDARTAARPGAFGGVLTATGDGVSVRTPVGLDRQPTVKLTLNHLDRTGRATSIARTVVAGLDSRYVMRTDNVGPQGSLELRLPAGRYLVSSTVMTLTGTGRTVTMLTDPELDLTADTVVGMDARLGKPVALAVDRPGAVQTGGYLNVAATVGDGQLLGYGIGGPFRDVFSARVGGGGSAAHVESRVSANFAEAGTDGSGTNSPWTVAVALDEPGTILDGYERTVTSAEMATVRQDLAAAVDGSTATLFNIPVWPGYGPDDFAAATEHALPGTRTDHFVSEGGVTWETQFWHNVKGMLDFLPEVPSYANSVTAKPKTYRAGRTYRESWNRGAFGPSFPGYGLFADGYVRDGDRITGVPNLYSDDQGRYASAITVGSFVRLDRDGQTVHTQTYPGLDVDVPPGEATYRLLVNTGRRPLVGLGTQNMVAWTFRSGSAAAARPLPLSLVRFLPNVDERNTVIGTDRYVLVFTTQKQAGSAAGAITALTLELSHDGGRTWVKPVMVRVGGTGVALVERPEGTGTVTIRSTATDAAGNTVEQTIANAYRY